MTPPAHPAPPLRPTLESLPYDLLHAIVTNLPSAANLTSLSATSRSLHRFVSNEGWHIFLTTHFPALYQSLALGSSGSDSRNSSGGGGPREPALCLAHTKRLTLLSRNHHRRTFTAHRLPAISTTATGQPTPSRRRRRSNNSQTLGFRPALAASEDALLVAAGPELVLHHKPGQSFRSQRFGAAGHDDILATALLSSGALIGQANGKLSHIHLPSSRASRSYDTGNRGVRSIAVAPDESAFSATLCAGESTLRIYNPSSAATPVEEQDVDSGFIDLAIPSSIPLWTSSFLSPRTIVAATTSPTPIRVFDLTSNTQIREFHGGSDTADSASCVFSLSPIPASTATFLAGWFSGATRLHDVRDPTRDHVVELTDPLDAGSAVYSLLPLDEHRVLVGGARHGIVKAFDTRMPGRGWGIYLPSFSGGGSNARNAKGPGAVYALAQMGIGGERVFAGVEGGVWQLDFSEGLPGRTGRRSWEEGMLMYEWGKEVTLWRQSEWGKPGGDGRALDARWKRVAAEGGRGCEW